MAADSDVARLGAALAAAKRNVYDHISTMVLISVCWFLASLPVMTIAPATVGAYAAIENVVETGRIDHGAVLSVVRRQFVPALVLGVFPPMFLFGGLFFTADFLETVDPMAALLAVGSFYAFAFSVLILIPAFVGLSRGTWAGTAVKEGYLWVVGHPTLAMTAGLVTLAVFVVTALLTIGFVLLFAGIAFTFHLAVVHDRRPDDRM